MRNRSFDAHDTYQRSRWPLHFQRFVFEPRLDLLRAEMWEPPPHRDDAFGDLARCRVGTAHGGMAQFLKPAPSSALPAPLPNIERLTANAVPPGTAH
jgi:hypothetical protein